MLRWAPLALGLVIALPARAFADELRIDPTSTCEGTAAMATRLAGRGVVLTAESPTKVTLRAVTTTGGAEASVEIEKDGRVATRTLTAPTCDEVLDAAAYTVSLSLEPEAPSASPRQPEAPSASRRQPEAPSVSPRQSETPSASLRWGGEATGGIFAGASPDVAAAIIVRADLESSSPRLFSPSASLGAAFVLPSTATTGGAELTFALVTGLVDACPLRASAGRFSLKPCAELQVGRLQSRGTGVPNARLEASTWAALGLALRGRAEVGAGLSAELALMGGSPLIQEEFSIGNSRVFDTGPFMLAATFGVGVHFP